jgi:site-specific DNA recombinase
MPKGYRAVIYSRVSTDDQADHGTSLHTQAAASRKLAEAEALHVVAEFREDYTGQKASRPVMNMIMEMARQDEFDVLICYDPDRFARKMGVAAFLEMELERFHIELLYVLADKDKLTRNIRAAIAEYEIEKILERTNRGKREKAAQGAVLAGGAPYGRRFVKGEHRFEIVEHEAQWVRQIYEWYVDEGLSMNGILRRLIELGVPTRGGQPLWYIEAVRTILRSESYCGVWHWNKRQTIEPRKPRKKDNPFALEQKTSHILKDRAEWVQINIEPIISRDVWEAAQGRVEQNKARGRRNRRIDYLLGGHVSCGDCGRKFSGISRKSRHGVNRTVLTYECTGKNNRLVAGGGQKCRSRNMSASKLEECIWGVITDTLTDPGALFEVAKGTQGDARANERDSATLTALQADLAALDGREEQLVELFETGGTSRAMYDKRRAAIEEQRVKLEAGRAEVQKRVREREVKIASIEAVQELTQAAQDRLPGLTYEQQRDLFDMMDLRVVIGRKELFIMTLITDRLIPYFGTTVPAGAARHITGVRPLKGTIPLIQVKSSPSQARLRPG